MSSLCANECIHFFRTPPPRANCRQCYLYIYKAGHLTRGKKQVRTFCTGLKATPSESAMKETEVLCYLSSVNTHTQQKPHGIFIVTTKTRYSSHFPKLTLILLNLSRNQKQFSSSVYITKQSGLCMYLHQAMYKEHC